jgi:hypothetical protein
MKYIQIFILKIILKILAFIFNRSEDVNNKLNELNKMKQEGRVILDVDLDERIFESIVTKIGSHPTKEHFLFVKEKTTNIYTRTGYYPSKQQMDFFISEYRDS